jgi:hypothetical protein
MQDFSASSAVRIDPNLATAVPRLPQIHALIGLFTSP